MNTPFSAFRKKEGGGRCVEKDENNEFLCRGIAILTCFCSHKGEGFWFFCECVFLVFCECVFLVFFASVCFWFF